MNDKTDNTATECHDHAAKKMMGMGFHLIPKAKLLQK
jgi:hypothetical protein